MLRIFVDMDGVTFDFEGYMLENGLTAEEVKYTPGSYANLKPLPGAVEAIRRLIYLGYDVWFATKAPTGVAHAYADKVRCVKTHIPEMIRKIIITHDKGLLGNQQDYIIDDRIHKANCSEFSGTVFEFKIGKWTWPSIVDYFEQMVTYKSCSISVPDEV